MWDALLAVNLAGWLHQLTATGPPEATLRPLAYPKPKNHPPKINKTSRRSTLNITRGFGLTHT